MPQVEGGPKALNDLLHEVYEKAIAAGDDEETASKKAFGAVHKAGWNKDADGKWTKSESKMEGDTDMNIETAEPKRQTKHVSLSFNSDAFVFTESKDDKYIGRIKGIAVTPGIHKSASGRLRITADVIKASVGKWKGLQLVDVHNSESVRAVAGEIVKDYLGPNSELMYEAGILNTSAGRDIIEVMKTFKRAGVSIGAAGDIEDGEDEHGWFGDIKAEGFSPVHLGIMQDHAQADKSAYAMSFSAAPEAMAALEKHGEEDTKKCPSCGKDMPKDAEKHKDCEGKSKSSEMKEGNSMAEENKELAVAASKDEEKVIEEPVVDKSAEELQAKDEEISSLKAERDSLAAKVAELETNLSKTKDAVVAVDKEKSELAAKLAELVAFKEGIDKDRAEAERLKVLSKCKEYAASLADAEIKFDEKADLATLTAVAAQLKDKIVERVVAPKVETRKAVDVPAPAASGKGSGAPSLPRYYSRAD